MQEIQGRPDTPEIKGDVLDMLVVMVENARLLVIGPLAAGLTALGVCFMVPQIYESVALFQTDQSVASLVTTATVLDPVITSFGLARNSTLQEARTKLLRQIKVSVGRADKLMTLTVSAPSPAQAQAISAALLQRTFVESRPKGMVRVRLETQLAEAQARLKNSQEVGESLRKRLESSATLASTTSEVARGYAELLGTSGAAQNQISALESQLEGLSDAQQVQAPTLPERPSQPRKGPIAIGAALATALALLLFVFMRKGFQPAAAGEVNSAKLGRIRDSLRLR